MPLTCECGYDDWDWFFFPPHDFTRLATKRGRRCCSCKAKIKVGADCGEFVRFRQPNSDVEKRIYGEDGEVSLASKWMCETCTGLFFALDELGFCVGLEEPMHALVKEYAEMAAEERKRGK